MLPKIDPTTTTAWKLLQEHFEEIKTVNISNMFEKNGNRTTDLGLEWDGFYLDLSKNKITTKTQELLTQLAEEVQVAQAIEAQFTGKKINETENRAVLHTALRDFEHMKPEVFTALEKMKNFSEALLSGERKGATGKRITDVVNIGIGGSHLGPEMVCEALQSYNKGLQIHFITNIDGDHVKAILDTVNPETTLFIVVSKSFGTHETITNAETVKKWFMNRLSVSAVYHHFLAVSANLDRVQAFGISEENTFPIWDWVGGRFSLWSSVGLSICCSIGYDHFEALLKGAYEMDVHFKEAPLQKNIPVRLALLSIWYTNFFNAETNAIVPYAEALHKLVPYLQQAAMESNGKSTDRNGTRVNYQTGTIVWGSTGANAQHAYFQLLHQGTKLIPVDFILFKNPVEGDKEHHKILVANCLAQAEALMNGTENKEELHKNFEGNKPSTTLLIEKLTPASLGKLIAMYEHKLFVTGIVWNIFSYDQWGVELGKILAKDILAGNEKTKNNDEIHLSASTQLLIEKIYANN